MAKPRGFAVFDRATALAAIEHFGSQRKAASALGVKRSTLFDYITKEPRGAGIAAGRELRQLGAEALQALPGAERKRLGALKGFYSLETLGGPLTSGKRLLGARRRLPKAERQQTIKDWLTRRSQQQREAGGRRSIYQRPLITGGFRSAGMAQPAPPPPPLQEGQQLGLFDVLDMTPAELEGDVEGSSE